MEQAPPTKAAEEEAVLLSQGILVSIVDISVEQLMLMLSYYYEEEGIANVHGRAVGHMIFLGSRMPTTVVG